MFYSFLHAGDKSGAGDGLRHSLLVKARESAEVKQQFFETNQETILQALLAMASAAAIPSFAVTAATQRTLLTSWSNLYIRSQWDAKRDRPLRSATTSPLSPLWPMKWAWPIFSQGNSSRLAGRATSCSAFRTSGNSGNLLRAVPLFRGVAIRPSVRLD
ncbi:MAG: hypothetical protein ABIP14_03820 [Blastocatellia bacterium]